MLGRVFAMKEALFVVLPEKVTCRVNSSAMVAWNLVSCLKMCR